MENVSITGKELSKSFYRKNLLFKDVAFHIENGDVLGVAGSNGSGKSTLLKIILGVLRPTQGEIKWEIDNKIIERDSYCDCSGFAAPYLNLYEEFTPLEFMGVISRIRGKKIESSKVNSLLEEFDLYEHRNKEIRNFSSGMKQRMKLLTAVAHSPSILILDEPSTNLDSKGNLLVADLIARQKQAGCALIIASNEESELALCTKSIFITTS